MALVVTIGTRKLPSICPGVCSSSVHLVVFPLPVIRPVIFPRKSSNSFYRVVAEIAEVMTTVHPNKMTGALFYPFDKRAFEPRSIFPDLLSVPVLAIVGPFPFVAGVLGVYQYSGPMNGVV
jgi:hypothetical protein